MSVAARGAMAGYGFAYNPRSGKSEHEKLAGRFLRQVHQVDMMLPDNLASGLIAIWRRT